MLSTLHAVIASCAAQIAAMTSGIAHAQQEGGEPLSNLRIAYSYQDYQHKVFRFLIKRGRQPQRAAALELTASIS